MTTLNLTLSEEKVAQLNQTAEELGLQVEELLRRCVDEYLDRRKKASSAMDYVLQKNAELYKRLA
jgi:antitoxin FitA